MRKQSSTQIYRFLFGEAESAELHPELIHMLFAYFKLDELPILALVNSAWHSLLNDNMVWEEKFRRRYPEQYEILLNTKDPINWREELRQTETKQTPMQKLDRYIQQITGSATYIDRELLAANALKAVILRQAHPAALDDYYFLYQNGKLGRLYKEIEKNKLIPEIIDSTEEDYGYGRPSFN